HRHSGLLPADTTSHRVGIAPTELPNLFTTHTTKDTKHTKTRRSDGNPKCNFVSFVCFVVPSEPAVITRREAAESSSLRAQAGCRVPQRETRARSAAGADRGGQGHTGHAGAAFGAAAGAAAFVARLFVKLAATHFLLDAAVFHQLPKP